MYILVFDNDIPIVTLVIGGDLTTLIAIHNSLNNEIPVVVARVRIALMLNYFLASKK